MESLAADQASCGLKPRTTAASCRSHRISLSRTIDAARSTVYWRALNVKAGHSCLTQIEGECRGGKKSVEQLRAERLEREAGERRRQREALAAQLSPDSRQVLDSLALSERGSGTCSTTRPWQRCFAVTRGGLWPAARRWKAPQKSLWSHGPPTFSC